MRIKRRHRLKRAKLITCYPTSRNSLKTWSKKILNLKRGLKRLKKKLSRWRKLKWAHRENLISVLKSTWSCDCRKHLPRPKGITIAMWISANSTTVLFTDVLTKLSIQFMKSRLKRARWRLEIVHYLSSHQWIKSSTKKCNRIWFKLWKLICKLKRSRSKKSKTNNWKASIKLLLS